MEKKPPNGSTDRQIGFMAGQIKGMAEAVNNLSNRFDEHLKEHRTNWLWLFPTLISLATLVVLILTLTGS
jgi:hypothetical protein